MVCPRKIHLFTYCTDEDFCLFADWPHNKIIIPLFDSSNVVNCTTSIKWLIQNYPIVLSTTHQDTDLLILRYDFLPVSHICNNSLNNLNATYFDKKVDMCKMRKSNITVNYDLSFDYDNMKFWVFSIQDLIVFICIPCVCTFGLILNIRVVAVIKKHEKGVLKEDFYKFISVNSKFNCIYCLIFAFYPINYCNQFDSDYFCSSIYGGLFGQYFKIVFIAYG